MKLKDWIKFKKDSSDLIVQGTVRSGMGHKFINNVEDALQNREKTKLVFIAFNTNTDVRRRGRHKYNRKFFEKRLNNNGFQNISLPGSEYFKEIGKYKFVVSPEGNGVDCHRQYEVLFAGCIPILEKNKFSETIYENYPILWTTNYSEINVNYLNNIYEKMLDTEYDFSKLFFSYYNLEI